MQETHCFHLRGLRGEAVSQQPPSHVQSAVHTHHTASFVHARIDWPPVPREVHLMLPISASYGRYPRLLPFGYLAAFDGRRWAAKPIPSRTHQMITTWVSSDVKHGDTDDSVGETGNMPFGTRSCLLISSSTTHTSTVSWPVGHRGIQNAITGEMRVYSKQWLCYLTKPHNYAAYTNQPNNFEYSYPIVQ